MRAVRPAKETVVDVATENAHKIPLPGVLERALGIPPDDSNFQSTTARYGNWIGKGWWGGSEMGDKVGAMPPEDALDALGQAHDMAYEIAEEAGRKYGEKERYRLLALADQVGYLAFERLPKDPRQWQPPPKDLAKAATYRDRFPITMAGLHHSNAGAEADAKPPTPEQAAALARDGKMDMNDLRAAANDRVKAWEKDRGTGMRTGNKIAPAIR